MPARATTPEDPPAERCVACAAPLVGAATGRPRRYCTDACRQASYRRRVGRRSARGLVRLVEGDARTLLGDLHPESVDLVVTDPPYVFARGGGFADWFADLPDDAWGPILAALHRVLRPDRHLYLISDRRTYPIFEQAARAAGFRVHEPLIWDRDWLGLGAGAWRSQYELVLFAEKGRRAGNSRSLGNVLRFRRPHRGYPTEKPVGLLKALIGQSSQPGELVLDPFCGSGNLGRAARELGRRALLFDVDTAFAAQRLRNADGGSERAVA